MRYDGAGTSDVSFGDGRYDLMETMAFDPVEGVPLLDFHMKRLESSARTLGFTFDRHAARNELQAATFRVRVRSRVRMMISNRGNMAIEVRAYRTWPQAIMSVAIVPCPIPADDPRLAHKTTDRDFYRDVLAKGGTFEVIMTDPAGYLTEGCFSSIFVERNDRLVTPPLSRGLLPGVLRQSLIEMGEAVEGDLRPYDLEKGFYIGNAARGMVAATLA